MCSISKIAVDFKNAVSCCGSATPVRGQNLIFESATCMPAAKCCTDLAVSLLCVVVHGSLRFDPCLDLAGGYQHVSDSRSRPCGGGGSADHQVAAARTWPHSGEGRLHQVHSQTAAPQAFK